MLVFPRILHIRRPLPGPLPRRSLRGSVATPKKKPKIQASEIEVDNRTLDGVLRELMERNKENAVGIASLVAQAKAHEERTARCEELVTIALQTIAAVTKDLRALAQRTDDRLRALESPTAAE